MSQIPHDASVSIKDTFRAVWKAIDSLTKDNIDMRGHQIGNLGDARMGSEAVTLRQLRDIARDPHVVTQVRIIQETLGVGPWNRVGTATQLVNSGDQVTIGATTPANTTLRLHVRSNAAATFPTLAGTDLFAVENSTTVHVAIIGGATNQMSVKFYGSGDTAADGQLHYNRNTRNLTLVAAATDRVRITSAGSLLCQVAGALATTATDGFTYLPTCAGAPTGVPTAQTGMAPIVVDTTNSKVYVYSGGAWQILN